MIVSGNLVDVHSQEIYGANIIIENGCIQEIERTDLGYNNFILPGLVDAHVHIESSMMVPSRFAAMVVPRGTVAVVSDPHEIANILGKEGVEYMMKDAEKVPLKCFFGVPSCVPATDFETSGGVINVEDVESLFKNGAKFLAEMMNYPGVIYGDSVVKSKLDIAKKYKKPIDGHAPGLLGDDLIKYVQGGISTDHECSTLDEALQKIKLGMMIQIREGSAARNFESLHSLIASHPDNVMVCTDDSHPDLIRNKGHIDRIIRLGLEKGYSIFQMYKAAVLNPVMHYDLPIGLLRKGDPADFIVVDSLDNFNVIQTFIDGKEVVRENKTLFKLEEISQVNNFNCSLLQANDLKIVAPVDDCKVRVIEADDGELLTGQYIWESSYKKDEEIVSDLDKDILKIVVVNRYVKSKPSIGFIRNFKLNSGAIASSVAHDSHNIVAIGCDDESLVKVINSIITEKGGIATCDSDELLILPLPIAGIMSDQSGDDIATRYTQLNEFVAKLGVDLKAPFMTLAFMSLLVIPQLKIGNRGLFDVSTFTFTDLFIVDE